MHTDAEWAPFGIDAARAAVFEHYIAEQALQMTLKYPHLRPDVEQEMWCALVISTEDLKVPLLPRLAHKSDPYVCKAMRTVARKWLDRRAHDGPVSNGYADSSRMIPQQEE